MASRINFVLIAVVSALTAQYQSSQWAEPREPVSPEPTAVRSARLADQVSIYQAVYKEFHFNGKTIIRSETDDCSALSADTVPREISASLWKQMFRSNSHSVPLPRLPGFTYESLEFICNSDKFYQRYPDSILGETVSLSLPGYDSTRSRALVFVAFSHSRGASSDVVELKRTNKSWKVVKNVLVFWIT